MGEAHNGGQAVRHSIRRPGRDLSGALPSLVPTRPGPNYKTGCIRSQVPPRTVRGVRSVREFSAVARRAANHPCQQRFLRYDRISETGVLTKVQIRAIMVIINPLSLRSRGRSINSPLLPSRSGLIVSSR